MEIKRDIYLNKLISKKQNGLVKVVTGVRRYVFYLRVLNKARLME